MTSGVKTEVERQKPTVVHKKSEREMLIELLNSFGQTLRDRVDQINTDPDFLPNPPGFENACRHWLSRDKWTLVEAANFTCACHPTRPQSLVDNTQLGAAIKAFVEFFTNCGNESLPIINPKDAHKKWLVRPGDFIAWAEKKGIRLPMPLLQAHRLKLEKKTVRRQPHGNSARFAETREQVLEAAFAVLAKFPDKCKDPGGRLNGAKVAKLIEQKSNLWWKATGEAPMTTRGMAEIINKALKTLE